MTIKRKIYVTSLVLLLLTLSFVSMYSYRIIKNTVLEKAYTSDYGYLETVRDSFENMMERSTPLIRQHKELLAARLQEYGSTVQIADRISAAKRMEFELQSFINDHRGFTGAMVVTASDSFFAGSFTHSVSYKEITTHPIHRQLFARSGHASFTSSSPLTFRNQLLLGERIEGGVGEEEAVIVYALDPDSFLSSDMRERSLIIYNQEREVVWATDDASIKRGLADEQEQDAEWFPGQEGSVVVGDYYVTYIHPPDEEYVYSNIVDMKVLTDELKRLERILFLLSGLLFVGGALSARFIIEALLSPLGMLKNTVSGNGAAAESKLAAWLSRFKMRNKLIVFLCVQTVVPAVVLIAVTYVSANEIVLDKTKEAIANTVGQAADNIGYLRRDMAEFTAELANLKDIQLLLMQEMADDSRLRSISEYIVKQNPLAGTLPAIEIYGSSGAQLYSTSNLVDGTAWEAIPIAFRNDEFRHTAWLDKRIDALGNQVYPFVRKVRLKYSDEFIKGHRDDSDSGRSVYSVGGLIQAQLAESSLERRYSSLLRSADNAAFIINAEGVILSHPDKRLIGSEMDLPIGDVPVASLPQQTISGGSLSFYYPIEGEGEWRLVMQIPTADIRKDNIQIWIVNSLVLLFVALIIVGCSFVFSWQITKPVVQLGGLISRLEAGDYSVRLPDRGERDELTLISRRFNELILKINALIEEVIASKLVQHELELSKQRLEKRKKEAEIAAFQSQINPHFLYNTFSSINFMIALGRNEDAIRMLDALGRLFRKGIFRGEVVVPIEEELEHVRAYLEIQEMRFGSKLRIVWQLDKGIEHHQMIKLTLQPLVENSIYHGIETLDHGGQITIEGRMQEGMICFHIRDDGVGIGEEQLAHIRRVLIDGETRQIGLKNVDNRIKLYFGEQYGVRIESEANVGTTVTLTLPLQSWDSVPDS
ncbi:putative sensor histidine kinase [Paenibacillus sp. 598K]|uniref:sensor histidine kinase n=1 Tax=Paenibacillus sp. 598K TaxID=1117987 RepID=UPI000FFAA77C|nr:sensor histidine kinase [Paenibacillus sp. 598K]GBF72447.1 putative sensor histidine kinase [Paenibacillus sp. 598K]